MATLFRSVFRQDLTWSAIVLSDIWLFFDDFSNAIERKKHFFHVEEQPNLESS